MVIYAGTTDSLILRDDLEQRTALGSRYVHVQSTPAATWTVQHNLGTKPPLVFELASDPNSMVMTDVTYPSLNTAVVEWPSAESGKAYI